ncbi:MAG: hypothetical protein GY852_02910, partial [bacterium]|nr:hypothetical protein [bacterium]
MSLRRNVFVRVMVLIVTLVLVICVTYSIFAIRHHRQEMKTLFKMKALILAGEVERLILWDDRVAMREALAREVKNHPEVMYV